MKKEDLTSLPEIYADLSAAFGDDRYFATSYGTLEDLKKLGLTPETAVGKRFLFNSGADCAPDGEPADIMFLGTFVRDSEYGVVVKLEGDVFWRAYKDGAISS